MNRWKEISAHGNGEKERPPVAIRTSWERLTAERDFEETAPTREKSRDLLSPLRYVWQLLRGKSDK
jgi:hypothetical protein